MSKLKGPQVTWEDDKDNTFEEMFAEIETEDTFGELLKTEQNSAPRQSLQVGSQVKGVVSHISATSDDITVDLGSKSSGVLSKRELLLFDPSFASIKTGQEIDAFVISRKDGAILLAKSLNPTGNKKQESGPSMWEILRSSTAKGSIVNGSVVEVKPFGAIVDIGGVQGMIHISELSRSRVSDPNEVVTVGQKVTVQVLNVEEKEEGRPRISLSLKALMDDPWDSVLEKFQLGKSYPGKVVRFSPFGAFVELTPGLQGMIHVSEMTNSGKRVIHPEDLFQLGQVVQARVLAVDPFHKKIGLSVKEQEDDGAWIHDLEDFQKATSLKKKEDLGSFGELLNASLKPKQR